MTSESDGRRPGAIAVTGANRGIGAGIALELARRGFRVGCLTRSGALPDVPTDVAPEFAARLFAVRCDVLDEAMVAAALRRVAEEPGGLFGLVNNAGILKIGPSESFDTADFAEILAVNATAPFAACKAAYPHFRARGGGVIVNIGSYWERLGVKRSTAYAASKAALGSITRCLAVEWAKQSISVFNVAPGYVATDMNAEAMADNRFREWLERRVPVGRPGTVGEVARLVAALCCEDLHYLTGETIFMDGAQTINQ